MKKTTILGALLLTLGGCYDAGPYGHDRHYVPLDAEEAFYERATEAVFNDVRTDPADFEGRLISWFGVVEDVAEGEGGHQIRLSFRTHQDRHLCETEERDTCRVTVSQASSGTFTAQVTLRPEDQQGRNRLGNDSLMRVYCSVTGDYDAEGGPLLTCEHYRYWARGQWAHTGMRDQLRR